MRNSVRKAAAAAALSLLSMAAQVTPASAAVSGADQAATKAFIGAEARYLNRALGKAATVTQASTTFVDHVAATCQNSLANLPSQATTAQQDTLAALTAEIGFDIGAATVAPLAGDLRAQSKAFSKLRWTRSTLNRAVATYIKGEGEILSIGPTDLCSDIAAASATNFAQPGQGTISLLNELLTVPDFKDPSQLQKLMRPFMTSASRAEAKRAQRTANKLYRAIDPALKAQGKRLVTVLFGSAPPPGSIPDLPR